MENFAGNSQNNTINPSESDDTGVAADVAALADENDDAPEETMESLMEMYEESLKRFEEGEVVNGRIISVDRDHVPMKTTMRLKRQWNP